MIDTMMELAQTGIETDFVYGDKDKYKLVVTDIEERRRTMIQAELQEEQEQIEDLEHQRVDYLNRAERIAERLTTLKAEHKEHIVEAKLTDMIKNYYELGHHGVIRIAQECLQVLQDN